MKKLLLTTVIMLLIFTACSEPSQTAEENSTSPTPQSTPGSTSVAEVEPLDLTGYWKQSSGDTAEAYMQATILEDTIEISMYVIEDDMTVIYWPGTYIAPTDETDEYKWTSIRDQEITGIFVSTADNKEFTYSNGKLMFDFIIQGETAQVELMKE